MLSDFDFLDEDGKYRPLGTLTPLDNQNTLDRLKQERALQGVVAGLHSIAPPLIPHDTFSEISLKRENIKKNKAVDKISNLIIVMERILEAFGDQVEIIPRVQVSKEETGIDQIDLFMRIPSERVYFCICKRKLEGSRIIYNDNRETLMFREKKRLTPWNPDPNTYIPKATSWLRKNKPTLFGRKGNDKRQPIGKILVLLGSTEIGRHYEKHYDTLADKRFLKIQNSDLYIVHKNQLVSVMQGFLKRYGKLSRKATKSKPKQSTTKKAKSPKGHRRNPITSSKRTT